MSRLLLVVLTATLGLASPASAGPPSTKAVTSRGTQQATTSKRKGRTRAPYGERLLTLAEQLEGVPYDFGGRLRGDEGIDCQGIIFYATERLGRCDWRSWSVMPTRTLARRELGAPAFDKAMLKGELDLTQLTPGDVLFFLGRMENSKEPALLEVETAEGPVPMWTWHMGLYAGNGEALHADPFTYGKVARQPLDALMTAGGFEALFATRPTAKSKPKKCRRGKKMRSVSPPPAASRSTPTL